MAEHEKRKRARTILNKSGYAIGGHLSKHHEKYATKHEVSEAVHEHEGRLHKGEKKTRLKLADGGLAEGTSPRRRSDRKSRDKKSHTTVNVLVGGHGGSQAPRPPLPVPVPIGGPLPQGGPPVGPPPPGLAGAGMPPPPMGQKRGGHSYRKGGRIKGYPIDDGAGGGLGRIEKAEKYGAKVRKGGRAE